MFKHLWGNARAKVSVAILGVWAALAGGSVFAFDESTGVDWQDKPAKWAVAFENDFFAPGTADKDYTFGASLTVRDERLSDHWATKPLQAIDSKLLHFCDKGAEYSVEVGAYAFTPASASQVETLGQDRPYASLIYAAAASERVHSGSRSVLRSQLSVGVLGSALVGDIQNAVHEVIGSEREQGWGQQISDGGELTLRYQLSGQNLLYAGQGVELKHTKRLSVGYITEASWGLSTRFGSINSVWYQFSPEISTYAEATPKVQNSAERYFWAGVAIKARAYNVFLQGQFRHSEISYNHEELNHVILEAWLGYTHGFNNGYYLSYGLRGHTSELKQGPADRNVVWGGLSLSKALVNRG